MPRVRCFAFTAVVASCAALLACAPPPSSEPSQPTPDETAATGAPSGATSSPAVAVVTDADPAKVRVAVTESDGNCNFKVVPGTVEVCRTGDAVCPEAANWEWAGDKGNFTHVYFVVKDAALNSCFATTDIGGGKKGFEIPRGGGVDKSVQGGCAGPAEYAYGILAERSSGADCTYDPKVKILD